MYFANGNYERRSSKLADKNATCWKKLQLFTVFTYLRLPIEWAPLDLFKRIADVNLGGMVDVTKTFLIVVSRNQTETATIGAVRITFRDLLK